MTLRVLLIEDEEVYRRLLAQHVSVGFEEPAIAEYDPAERGRLPADFHASGYDAVLLDETPGVDTGLDWLKDFRQRKHFPPVIFMMREISPEAEREARAAGALAILSKGKIDNAALVEALRLAQEFKQRPSEPEPGVEEEDRTARFGKLIIRGYQFVRKLAENPVSTVYVAKRLSVGDQVVLKVMKEAPDADGQATEAFDRFLREYQIASAIRHPNVVRIFDFGVADDHAFIAMEYFPGGDLRKAIRSGFSHLEALRLLRQMAEALGVLHGAGVLHRDLKPGNVMLREDGSIVLIDFGMSKQVEVSKSITGSGLIFGTPYYMSPEQGHGREVDERSDIYSLGIMFYEMLMRRKPYVAGTPMKVIFKHANAPLPELPTELKRLESILYKCIAKDPAHRYASTEELVEAIRQAESDETESQAMGI